MSVSVRHRRLPFGMVWVPMLSVGLYLLVWLARPLIVSIVRARQSRVAGSLPVEIPNLSSLFTQASRVLLCSGSYTLLDVDIPNEGLRVTIRLI